MPLLLVDHIASAAAAAAGVAAAPAGGVQL
jgi:hypothetical protein